MQKASNRVPFLHMAWVIWARTPSRNLNLQILLSVEREGKNTDPLCGGAVQAPRGSSILARSARRVDISSPKKPSAFANGFFFEMRTSLFYT